MQLGHLLPGLLLESTSAAKVTEKPARRGAATAPMLSIAAA
jgi:hypothetical protein